MEPKIPRTSNAKYLFVDVVAFTTGRSVEAQTEIVGALNSIVRASVLHVGLTEGDVVFIPTGDGVCVGMLDVSHPYDVHLQLAEEVFGRVAEHNAAARDDARRFDLRGGVGANVDNVLLDINGNPNVAGVGINTAQRAMSLADAGQIMVTQTVYDVLAQRETYREAFRRVVAQVKHGQALVVYQYVKPDREGINTAFPSVLASRQLKRTGEKEEGGDGLSELAACYLAEAIEHESEMIDLCRVSATAPFVITVLLYYRASDRVARRNAPPYIRLHPKTKPPEGTFTEQFSHYKQQDSRLYCDLSHLVVMELLTPYRQCFEGPAFPWYLFASQVGRERLRAEWPEIAAEVAL